MDNDAGFECLVCLGRFNELAFYGCCTRCYCSSAETRAVVDEAHPQTIREPVEAQS